MSKVNLTGGGILGSLFRFSMPMVVVSILQMLFHTADTAVLGILSGDLEVAAVGACGSLVSMLVCLVTGYASAANVVISRRIGAGDRRGARVASGAAIVMGILSGLALMVVVLIFSRRFLIMTNCQPEVLDLADLYLKIYFLGMPITMLYNFVSSILRASGDSMRPMIYMIVSGVFNVALNVLFVGAFGMTVAGVALATVISNLIALALSLIALARNNEDCKIERKNLRLRKKELFEMIGIGLPSCLSGLSFYLGEVVVVSAVNSLGTAAMTANSISSQLDRVNYVVGSSIASAAGVMISQNFGAGYFDRIRKIMIKGALFCGATVMVIGLAVVACSDVLIGIFTDSPSVVALTKERLVIISLTNFVTCVCEVFSNSVRALKRPRTLLVVGVSCGFFVRSAWTWWIWPHCPTIPFLFLCLPLSTLVGMAIYFYVYKRAMKREKAALERNE